MWQHIMSLCVRCFQCSEYVEARILDDKSEVCTVTRLGAGRTRSTTRQQICVLSTKAHTGSVAHFVLLRYWGTQR